VRNVFPDLGFVIADSLSRFDAPKAWLALLLDTADEVGLPSDPEFRSALVAYLEWGSRLAVINSQPGAEADADLPMPRWGWGVPGGPYQG
jgi:hemoglobin